MTGRRSFSRHARRITLFVLITMLLSAAGSQITSADKPDSKTGWPQFLGPARNGVSSETGLLSKWPAGGLKEVWRVSGGVGMCGVVVQDGRAVTMVQRAGRQWLVVLDAKTGEEQAAIDLAPKFENAMGAGPRSTPSLHGDLAFAYSGEGILFAVDLSKAKILWQRKVIADLGGQSPDYGVSCSPLVYGDTVIVVPGAPDGAVAAFQTRTGEPAWTAQAEGELDTAGYSSPALLQIDGQTHLVAFCGTAALGIDPDKGNVLWRYPYATDFDCNIATPVGAGGKVFLSAGENHGSVLLNVTHKQAEYVVNPQWESHGNVSVMRNEWQTSILHDGHLYGFDNVGAAGPVSHLTCIDAATGKRKWQQLRFGKGNLTLADGKLFITTIKGELVVVGANPEKFEELGRMPVLESTRQAPAIADGQIYIRDNQDIVCLDARAAQ
jgi:outer membrane protein assembly factor BamB